MSEINENINRVVVGSLCVAERTSVEVVDSEGPRADVVALGQAGAGASSERLEEEIRRPRSVVVNGRQEGQRQDDAETRKIRLCKHCGQ